MANVKSSLAHGSSTPMLCGHWGGHSVFQPRSEGTQYGHTPWEDSRAANAAGIDGQIITKWRVLECSTCHQPTLVQEVGEYSYNDDEQGNPTIDAADTTVLYPRTATKAVPADLPPKIEEDVTVLLNFIEVIFVYLYTTPTKVLAFKERLKKTP